MVILPALPKIGLRITAKLLLGLSALILFVTPPSVHGQTRYYTASHPLRLQGFANFAYAKPAFNQPGGTGTDYGVAFGGDLDIGLRTWVIPGFDMRGSLVHGPVTSENTYSFGPRVVLPFSRVQPYGDFLVGFGKIDFNKSTDPNYLSDRSSVYTYGGGVDIPLNSGWGVRIDGQRERWRLTHNQPPFYPLLVTVGVRYEIHGGKHSPQ